MHIPTEHSPCKQLRMNRDTGKVSVLFCAVHLVLAEVVAKYARISGSDPFTWFRSYRYGLSSRDLLV